MTTDGWMVAPEQVSAVLRAVDAAGEPLSDTVTTGQTLAGRRTDLMASGRAVIAEAWDDFMDTRALVPGKVIDVVTSAAAAVVDGVLVIIAGDESMADEWRGGHPELFSAVVMNG
jgi:hypothetical protein